MRKTLWVVGAVVVAGAVFLAVGLAMRTGLGPLPDPEGCTARVAGHETRLSLEQGRNAALMAAISVRRGLPPRAASIAIATSMQESKLLNLAVGDRDSVGLFQQRPSQGWGTRRQLLDPVYATNAFYDALVQVAGYESMPITEAAQAVQRSAYPDAYAQHETAARTLASALTGETRGGRFSCVVHADTDGAPDGLDDSGLTRRAEAVRHDLVAAFGDLPLGGFQPGGVHEGHMSGSAHYEGRAIDVFVRPVTDANNQRGWAIAAYLVARAEQLGIEHVIFDGRIWTAGSASESGWRHYRVPSTASGDRAILEHRDHVHVDVFD